MAFSIMVNLYITSNHNIPSHSTQSSRKSTFQILDEAPESATPHPTSIKAFPFKRSNTIPVQSFPINLPISPPLHPAQTSPTIHTLTTSSSKTPSLPSQNSTSEWPYDRQSSGCCRVRAYARTTQVHYTQQTLSKYNAYIIGTKKIDIPQTPPAVSTTHHHSITQLQRHQEQILSHHQTHQKTTSSPPRLRAPQRANIQRRANHNQKGIIVLYHASR